MYKSGRVLLPLASAFMTLAALWLPASALPQDSGSPPPWMNRSLSPERRAALLVERMTLDEKITMFHGVSPIPIKGYVGYVPPNTRLAIPALRLADGRAGVGNGAKDVTLMPAPIAAAASWDRALMNSFGKLLGDEEWRKGANVALAPSIDVIRVPQWGRTFESYGEDPYFNGQMAIAEIEGIQSEGPIADENMYLTMNQEDNRLKEDSVVDERTLQEIYLPPFEAATKDAHVGTAMCAYVKTNGVYSCENLHLLHDLLKTQLGFDGWVMSDWGATHSTVDSVNHGLDQQMPDAEFYGAALKDAVNKGMVSTETINEHVRRILVPMFRQGLFDKQQTGDWLANVRSAEHDAFSRAVAEQGTVLLKNDRDILPLLGHSSIAVIGMAGDAKPKVEGGGSSWVEAPYAVSPLDGIRKRAGAGSNVTYGDGNDLTKAANVARAAKVAIVFVNTAETEGADRRDLRLPDNQDQLISAVAAANPNTIVVLDTGGPVLMTWITHVRGVIQAWYPGQEDGNAIAAILYGDVNPAAKLPLTFPRSESAVPTASAQQWPGVNGISKYDEKLNVGYRWYDSTNTAPLFPFGFGLSYTTFKLSHLTVSRRRLNVSPRGSGESVQVAVAVTNTGKLTGAEVVQVYVEQPVKNGEPPRQLRGFAKVELKSGETKRVILALDKRSFSIYDTAARRWTSPEGTYVVLVGTSSRDLPLHSAITVTRPASHSAGDGHYHLHQANIAR
jgi:beta-glucosidase